MHFSRQRTKTSNTGFTLVELLIVIVVIAILAAITIVAYSNISNRAMASALESDLRQATDQLGTARVDTGSYPLTNSFDPNASLKHSAGNVFQYTSDGTNYCLTDSSDKAKLSFHFDSTVGSIQTNPCTGHTGYTAGGGEAASCNSPGGSIAWGNTTSFATGRYNFGVAAYNCYIYVVGGSNGSNLTDVQYAPINTNGSIGAWQTTTSISGSGYAAVAYNGYLYSVGSSVQYAPINADGTLGTWTSISGFSGTKPSATVSAAIYMFTT